MAITKIGRRGQIVLPKEVREALGVEEGDRVAFVKREGGFLLHPLKQTLLDLRGSVPVTGPQDFEAIREEVKRVRACRQAVEVD